MNKESVKQWTKEKFDQNIQILVMRKGTSTLKQNSVTKNRRTKVWIVERNTAM